MPYDEQLAHRIREILSSDVCSAEKKMFGGLAFLLNGHMMIAASGKGGILVRCGSERYAKLSEEDGVEVAVMRGKKMNGWLRVPASRLKSKRQLQRWIKICAQYMETLPAR